MAPTTTRAWILANKPTDLPVLSADDENATFKLATRPLPKLEEGQVLLKILHISNDPAQRLWISSKIPRDRLYTTPVEVGDVMSSMAAVAEVVESRSAKLPVGTLVSGMAGWCEFAVVPAEACFVIKPVPGLTPTDSVALFGVAAITAYYGLVDILQAGSQDAIVISGAAGAVGSVAVQIAKKILKCRKVIGIAGTDAKCRWVEETLGADVCLNYKSATFEADLSTQTEGFVEAFFDNAGGEVLDLMLTRLKMHGRVAACGAISEYNAHSPVGIKNWYHVIAMRLQIKGFIVLDAIPSGRWDEITDVMVQGYLDGKIIADEKGVTIVPAKFEDVPTTWMRLFEGQNTGKLLTQLM